MAGRTNKPVSVTLGMLGGRAEERVKSGQYCSLSEVVRAGRRALDREEQLFEALLKAKVAEALADERPDVPADVLSDRLLSRHRDRLARGS